MNYADYLNGQSGQMPQMQQPSSLLSPSYEDLWRKRIAQQGLATQGAVGPPPTSASPTQQAAMGQRIMPGVAAAAAPYRRPGSAGLYMPGMTGGAPTGAPGVPLAAWQSQLPQQPVAPPVNKVLKARPGYQPYGGGMVNWRRRPISIPI